jgi:penicillin-binding protein 1A
MPKSEILLNYLNTINLGHNTLGVEAASQRYFNKHASELSLAQCAVLAAITQNPTAYDPIVYPEGNRERQEVVLEHMLTQGYITQEQYDAALAEDVYTEIASVNVDKEKVDNRVNSYFVDALIRQVLRDLQDEDLNLVDDGLAWTEDQAYGMLYSGGLRIYSTQNPVIQSIVDKQCSEDSGNFPAGTTYYLNYALTVVSPDGTETNYDSNNLEAYFRERDDNYSILYTSRSRAKEDVEAFRKSVVGPDDWYDENYELAPQPEISLTIEDQSTGHVLAMVGGCLYFVSTYSGTLISKSEELTKVQTIETYLRGQVQKVEILTLINSDDGIHLNNSSGISIDKEFNLLNGGAVVVKNTGFSNILIFKDTNITNGNRVAIKCQLFKEGSTDPDYTFILGIVEKP